MRWESSLVCECTSDATDFLSDLETKCCPIWFFVQIRWNALGKEFAHQKNQNSWTAVEIHPCHHFLCFIYSCCLIKRCIGFTDRWHLVHFERNNFCINQRVISNIVTLEQASIVLVEDLIATHSRKPTIYTNFPKSDCDPLSCVVCN